MPKDDPKKKKLLDDEGEKKLGEGDEDAEKEDVDDMAEDDEDGAVDWTSEEREY
jgi:hypothetical protein